ncbi:DUF1287 domain-containing protein [Roseovarius sp.]|uniref:DUF1287 domain-containing protein n=1 Tax=Roseovarius sp. TaxID=1486281 RepID=UPI003D10B1A2
MGLHRLPLIAAAVLAAPAPAMADALAEAAADQVGVTVIYDPSYVGLDFPGGDVPRERGVCTDVVIRALRDAYGIDLQLAVNRDMKADFAAYPALWGLSTTDRNIDHRRVPNLETLLRRIGAARDPSDDPDDFAPGDIVSWRLAGLGLPHIGIVSEGRSADGARPLVTHNIGWGTRTEDILFDHDMVLRARLDAAARDRLRALAQ